MGVSLSPRSVAGRVSALELLDSVGLTVLTKSFCPCSTCSFRAASAAPREKTTRRPPSGQNGGEDHDGAHGGAPDGAALGQMHVAILRGEAKGLNGFLSSRRGAPAGGTNERRRRPPARTAGSRTWRTAGRRSPRGRAARFARRLRRGPAPSGSCRRSSRARSSAPGGCGWRRPRAPPTAARRPAAMRSRAKETSRMLLAVATPMVMIAPVSAGTDSVVPVMNSIQPMPASAAGSAVMMMNGSSQRLEIDDDQQIDEHDRHQPGRRPVRRTSLHGLDLAAQRDCRSRAAAWAAPASTSF